MNSLILILISMVTFRSFYNVKTQQVVNIGTVGFELQGDTLIFTGRIRGDFSHSSVKTYDSPRIFNDDYVRLIVSDGSNSYSFIFNPAGTKRDEIVYINSFYTSPQWDGNWDVISNFKDSMWIFKVKIYNWFLRKFRVQVIIHEVKGNRDLVLSVCKNPLYCYKNFRVIHFKKMETAWIWSLKPYFALKYQENEKVLTSLGADLTISRGAKLKLGVTLNPDYSELESDPEMIDLEGKPIYLPEKRDFFKDDIDYMNFYTRSISKPLWGIKVVRRSANPSFLSFIVRDSAGINYFYNYLNYRLTGVSASVSSMIYDSTRKRSYHFSFGTLVNAVQNTSVNAEIDLYRRGEKTGFSYDFGFGRYRNVQGFNAVLTLSGRDSLYAPETQLLFLNFIHKSMISLWYKWNLNFHGISSAQVSAVTHNWFDWNFANKRYNKNTFSVDVNFRNGWRSSFFVVDEWMDWQGILKFAGISTSKISSGWDVVSLDLIKGVIGDEGFFNTAVSFGKSLDLLNFSIELDHYYYGKGKKSKYIARLKGEMKLLKRILLRTFLQTNTFSSKKTLNFLVDYEWKRFKLLSAANFIEYSGNMRKIYTVKFVFEI